uniref:exodeoxyribonuclease III n=1 Tax=Poecilia latipinna TaxID=48699 RepID=A0A3B3UVV5_9TELE
ISQLHITTINTRGLRDEVKCQSVFDHLHNSGGDLFLLQECGLPFMENYSKYEKRWPHGWSIWSGDNQNTATGVAILFNNKKFQIEKVENIVDGRVLLIDLDKEGFQIRLINVYGPTDLSERVILLQNLQSYICCGKNVIIAGDFNCILEKRGGNSKNASTNRTDTSSKDYMWKMKFGKKSKEDISIWKVPEILHNIVN